MHASSMHHHVQGLHSTLHRGDPGGGGADNGGGDWGKAAAPKGAGKGSGGKSFGKKGDGRIKVQAPPPNICIDK